MPTKHAKGYENYFTLVCRSRSNRKSTHYVSFFHRADLKILCDSMSVDLGPNQIRRYPNLLCASAFAGFLDSGRKENAKIGYSFHWNL